MRTSVIAVLVLVARVAYAQPVSFQLKAEVPIGQKPQLTVSAVEAVTDLRLELERNDGKTFSLRHPAIAKARTVTLPIGDGAGGKASYKGTLSVLVAGKRWTEQLTFDTLVRVPLKVTYDADHLELDAHELKFKLSRPAARAELIVFGEDGKQLGTGSATYTNPSPDTWLSIGWEQPENTRVMTMKLRVVASDGQATNVELIPWSVSIEHEDVNFPTNSATIEAGEAPKLDASVTKISEVIRRGGKFMKMRLYIAGHTDTVGANAKNRKLSLDRARAIAQYFRTKGIQIAIAFAGFGEEVLLVKTADNTDERRNRRVDYVIGPAAGAPPFSGPYLRVKADWKQLP